MAATGVTPSKGTANSWGGVEARQGDKQRGRQRDDRIVRRWRGWAQMMGDPLLAAGVHFCLICGHRRHLWTNCLDERGVGEPRTAENLEH